ncbi:MAG TPA: acyl-CoA dehydrogenase family protein, partial [Gemmatimonadaceae bacterium]|nr:acyl-CoA dehydrogenase family protein [Gemmatimonadaceae bacterium]
MTDTPPPSFTRGIFAGVIHDDLLFPYPPPLDVRNAEEAAVVRRLIAEIDRLEREKIIDPGRFDDEERVSEEVISEFGRVGLLGLTIPRQYGGLELSVTAYARVFERISAVDPSLA